MLIYNFSKIAILERIRQIETSDKQVKINLPFKKKKINFRAKNDKKKKKLQVKGIKNQKVNHLILMGAYLRQERSERFNCNHSSLVKVVP